jgi:ribonuclease E
MLENEPENNESADGRSEASEPNGGTGRGLLRRARRAVTRPAGPPAAEMPPAEPPPGAEVSADTASAEVSPAQAASAEPPAAPSAPQGAPPRGGSTAEAATKPVPVEGGEPEDPVATRAQEAEPEVKATSAGRSSRSRSARTSSKAKAGSESAAAEQGAQEPVSALAPAFQPAAIPQSASTERPAVPPAAFQPPMVIFQAPEIAEPRPAAARPSRAQPPAGAPDQAETETETGPGDELGGGTASSRKRRRGGRGRGRSREGAAEQSETDGAGAPAAEDEASATPQEGAEAEGEDATTASGKRRRRRRRSGSGGDGESQGDSASDDPPNTVVHVRSPRASTETDVRAVKGSTRLEAKRQRRREGRDSGRRRPPIITESEFLARREAVERVMVVRQHGDRTQIAVLEDGVLVEHYVDKASHQSYVGNVYLGKVQNVLPSMEAAFVDIGKGRNAVLYAGEVNFDASGLEGESKRIESALKSGQSIVVQVTKDPIGHKGARLTSQVSLPGRYLVYVPGASMTGISRKLPDTERSRLKQILKQVMPENAGVIVRTAAEGASEEELARDVARLSAQWEAIERKAKTASAPDLLYSEPDLTLRVIRDIFNEDFTSLVVASDGEWDMVDEYVRYVAPHLADRMQKWDDAQDVFGAYRIDEQIAKALERKVWLPSGGSLVIDHTEAMNIIDVNTGKFTGQGGNLEQTVTRNNLEAAEEIVRQLRLRDLGGIIVIDFIDMVLESNRELVLRRLLECLARDRTKHQVAEVTSLGLVQMTRKRVGSGLLEAFSVPCEHCNGRGVIISMEPVDHTHTRGRDTETNAREGHGNGRSGGKDQPSSRNGAGRGARGGQAARGRGKDGQAAEGATGDGGPSRSRSSRSSRSGEQPSDGQAAVGSTAIAAASHDEPEAADGNHHGGEGHHPAGEGDHGAAEGGYGAPVAGEGAASGSGRSRARRGRVTRSAGAPGAVGAQAHDDQAGETAPEPQEADAGPG